MKTVKQIVLSIAATVFVFDEVGRDFINRQVRAYTAILVCFFSACCMLVVLGVTIPSATLAGILFFLVLIIFVIVTFPPRVIIWNCNYKPIIDSFIGWMAFVGWLGMMHNTWLNFPVILIGFFLVAIFNKFMTAGKPIKVIPIVVLLFVGLSTALTLWSWSAPDSYRASSRYFASLGGVVKTEQDRRSFVNEGNQATYGKLIKDVKVAYEVVSVDKDGRITKMRDITVFLSKDSVFLIVNNKKENSFFEGQSFVEIKTPNSNGSFVTGNKIWIEADLIKVGSREEMENLKKDNFTSFNDSQNSKSIKNSKSNDEGVDMTFNNPGVYSLSGVRWVTVGPCRNFNFTSDNITLVYKDGSKVNVWQIKKIPNIETFKVINHGQGDVKLIIKTLG